VCHTKNEARFQPKICDKTFSRIYHFFVTLFSRFGSQPSGNNGSQKDTLRLPCHDANWIEHTDSDARNTDALPTHTLWFRRCWDVFFTWGPALLKCYGPRAILIWHWPQPTTKHFEKVKGFFCQCISIKDKIVEMMCGVPIFSSVV